MCLPEAGTEPIPVKEGSDSEDDELKKEQLSQMDYGYRERAIVLPEDDCFTKLQSHLESSQADQSNLCILHSRFAEIKRYYEVGENGCLGAIPDDHAHPNMDEKGRFSLFHNGLIANYDELIKEIIENKDVESHSTKNMTDSQLITALISSELDKNLSLKDALKNVVEQKLLGTYRIALMEMKNPKQLYFVKNSGDFFLGVNKTSTEIIVSTDFEVLK